MTSLPPGPTPALPIAAPRGGSAVGAPARLQALRRSGLMTAAADDAFDRACHLVTRLLGVPTALVTLVEPGRQVYKGAAGAPAPLARTRESRLADSPCQQVVARGRALVADCARRDAAVGEGQAYLGVPLRGPDGEILGGLCAIDTLPRTWTADDQAALTDIAALLTDSVAAREAAGRLSREARTRADAQALADAAINALDDVFVVAGVDGRLRQWNQALGDVTGLDADDLDGLGLAALVAPAHADRVRDALRQALAGPPTTLSAELLTAAGPVRHELTCSRVCDSTGAVVGVCVTGRDVTDQLRHQAALRLSEARHRGLVEAVPDLILRLSRDGRYLDVKAPDAALLVLKPDELVGRTMAESLPPELATTLTAVIEQALDTGALQCVEYDLVTSDGQARHFEARIVPVGSDEVQAVIRDVTARGAASRALRESEVRFRSFVEATTQVVWMADADGEVTELSAAWATFTGQTAEEIAGWGWAEAVHPDDLPRVIEAWTAAIAAHAPLQIEYRVRSRAGEYHRFDVRAIPVSDGAACLGWVGTCTDIEDARRAAEAAVAHEAALVAAMADAQHGRAQAEEAARMKSALLANLSHEIRTPLTSIIGFADILAEEAAEQGSGGEDETFAQLIGRGGRRLLHTLSSVLDLAQLEAGRHKVALARVDLRAVVAETAALLRAQAEDKNLHLTLALPDGPAVALADEGALARILTNLVGNAVKYTDEGAVALALRADAAGVEIEVSDTGRGISGAFLPLLFDEFRQESEGDARRYEGNGLGLAITKRLVEMLGGTIAAESVLGKGSTFTVRLPAMG